MQVKKEMDRYPNDEALHEELKKNHEKFLLDLGEGRLLPMQQLMDTT